MENFKAYIAFHKDGKKLSEELVYTELQVGKKVTCLDLDMEDDSTGDNISDKNHIYSELTGWYWIWKNKKHDYVGTSHYRRYFTASNANIWCHFSKLLLFFVGLKKKRHGLYYVSQPKFWLHKILSENEMKSILKKYDVILPQKKIFKYSVYDQYRKRHNEEDIKITRKILEDNYPDYLQAFDTVFNGRELYAFNMFIMPWQLFDNYMEWLFSILFKLEKKADIDLGDTYQKRVCAFMAERLKTVWVQHQNLKAKELPVLYFKKMKQKHF